MTSTAATGNESPSDEQSASFTPGDPLEGVWIVGFSGHRPSNESGRTEEDLLGCRDELTRVFEQLLKEAHRAADQAASRSDVAERPAGHRPLHLLCGCAPGADVLAIEVAEKLDIPVHLIVPAEGEAFRRLSFEGFDKAWQAAQDHIERAQRTDTDWTYRVIPGPGAQAELHQSVNNYILQVADVVVAICKQATLETRPRPDAADTALLSRPADGAEGGTAEMLRAIEWYPTRREGSEYEGNAAELRGYSVDAIIIDPSTHKCITTGDWAADTWRPVEGVKLLRRADSNANTFPLRTINAVLTDPVSRSDGTGQRGWEERAGGQSLWWIHHVLDATANAAGSSFRARLERSLWLHASATLVACIAVWFALSFPNSEVFPYAILALALIETTLVGFAFSIRRFALRARNRTWLDTRFAAELSDGILRSATLTDPLRPVVVGHLPQWKRFALSLSLAAYHEQRRQRVPLKATEASRRYIDRRLGRRENDGSDRELMTQIGYFYKMGSRAHVESHRLHRRAQVFAAAALMAVFVGLLLASWKILVKKTGLPALGNPWGLLHLFKYVLPVLLPAAVSLCTALWLVQDSGRREKRFSQVRIRLERYAAHLRVQSSPADIEGTVRSCEDLLLDELIDWEAIAGNMERVE